MTAPMPDVEKAARAFYAVEARQRGRPLIWEELDPIEQEERCTAMAAGIETLLTPSDEVVDAGTAAIRLQSHRRVQPNITADDLVSLDELPPRVTEMYKQQASACIRAAVHEGARAIRWVVVVIREMPWCIGFMGGALTGWRPSALDFWAALVVVAVGATLADAVIVKALGR